MAGRRHHNNKGQRQVKTGKVKRQVDIIARKLLKKKHGRKEEAVRG